MSGPLKRLFTIADAHMLQFAKTLRVWFIADQAQFEAEDTNYATPFENDWENAIDAAENEPTDEQRQDQLTQLTVIVEQEMTNCRNVFQGAKRYVKKAFPNSQEHWNEFGFDDYDSIEKSQPRMVQFMNRFFNTATKYTAQLTDPAVNFTAARIAEVESVKDALDTANNDQEVFKKDMLTFTRTRIEKLNAVWGICTDVAGTGKFVFKDNVAKYQHYLLPASEEAPGVLSLTGTVTGASVPGIITPLADVEVVAENAAGQFTVQTGPDGKFGMGGLAPGDYSVRFSHPDYTEEIRQVTIIEGETTTLDVQLMPLAPPPPPMP